MKTITKKIHPEHFAAVQANQKLAELRKEDDVRFEAGDLLILEEWDLDGFEICMGIGAIPVKQKGYTGHRVERLITHVLRDCDGLADGWAIVSSLPIVGHSAPTVQELTEAEINHLANQQWDEKGLISVLRGCVKAGFAASRSKQEGARL